MSLTIMHTTYERCTKARLNLLWWASHAPVNMADSMENAGSWTVSGFKEAMEVPKNFKDLQKLDIRDIHQYSTAFCPPTFTSSILSPMFSGVWPAEKLSRLPLVPCSRVL